FEKMVPKSAYPPVAVVRDMLARPDPPVPRLVRIVEVPILTRHGDILDRPGYDRESGILFAPPAGFVVPSVPVHASTRDVVRARELLLELVEDFPFTGEAERAHAVAMLLEGFVRELIDGPTPLYVIEKPAPGTGASLLADQPAR